MSIHQAHWESPSNIAIVKYWGKYGNQLPRNASISLTLSKAVSKTKMSLLEKTSSQVYDLQFYFDGDLKPDFTPKTAKLFDQMAAEYPWLKDYQIRIDSSNTFPHSSGIASSASGMSALAVCVADLDAQIKGNTYVLDDTTRLHASNYARLGSGSASRSLYPKIGQWGALPDVDGTSNEHAVSWEDKTADVFKTFHDDILIVSKEEKSVSSTAGHGLMDNSVYAAARYQQANDRLIRLFDVLKDGDVDEFGRIAEDDALTLHGLMMCSEPSFTLLAPGSISIINAIRAFRQETKLPVYFTIDAGPNIHMLYPDQYAEEVKSFKESELRGLCAGGQILEDIVGDGPRRL